jgi:hypothetical protein
MPRCQVFADNFDEDAEEEDQPAEMNPKGEKKQRSWLGKVGKGLYRRASNLAQAAGMGDAPMSKEEEVSDASRLCLLLAMPRSSLAILVPSHAICPPRSDRGVVEGS